MTRNPEKSGVANLCSDSLFLVLAAINDQRVAAMKVRVFSLDENKFRAAINYITAIH